MPRPDTGGCRSATMHHWLTGLSAETMMAVLVGRSIRQAMGTGCDRGIAFALGHKAQARWWTLYFYDTVR